MSYGITVMVFAMCGILVVGQPYSYGAAYWNRFMLMLFIFAGIYTIMVWNGIHPVDWF